MEILIKFISELILHFFAHDPLLDIDKLIINVLFYMLFYKQLYGKNSINTQTLITSYDDIITAYITNIKLKYNFDLIKLNHAINKKIITLFVSEQIYKTRYNIIEFIYNIGRTRKELKQHKKILSDMFTPSITANYIISYIRETKVRYTKAINLFSGTGSLVLHILNYISDYKNLTLVDNDSDMNIISSLNFKLFNNIDMDGNILNTDIIHDNEINNSYDLVIADIPIDIKNLIHAKCCNRIKQFKIRGTKSEPLIIQLIMSILAPNGLAIIVVPDSMLFSDSQQHVMTRKYLYENFNIKKVIACQNKKSILIFSNEENANDIILTDLDKSYSLNINEQLTIDNNYSLYYYNYNLIRQQVIQTQPFGLQRLDSLEKESSNNELSNNGLSNNELSNDSFSNNTLTNTSDRETFNNQQTIIPSRNTQLDTNTSLNVQFKNIVNLITTLKDVQTDPNTEYLYMNKLNNLKIDKISNLTEGSFEYIFQTKNESIYMQKYLNNHMMKIFERDRMSLTKGKTAQIDTNVLNNYILNIPPYQLQQTVSKYIDQNNTVIQSNNNQIALLEKIKNIKFNEALHNIQTYKLKTLVSIRHLTEQPDQTIVINRNSNMAGTVSYGTNISNTTNLYYIRPLDPDDIDNRYLYYILKSKEHILETLSRVHHTIQLSKSSLENLDINIPNIHTQKNIVNMCYQYDNKIESLNNLNKNLTFDDFFE